MTDEHDDMDAAWTDWERRVRKARPKSYKTDDLDWAEDLLTEARRMIDTKEAVAIAAVKRLRALERRDVHQANKLLRDIKQTCNLPLDWMELATFPIVIGEERIQLGECNSSDFRDWELAERRRAASDFTARNESCDGAQMVIEWMEAQDAKRLRDLDPAKVITKAAA